ncbi:methyltransferase domain-containing protein [Pseudomonas asiatica]|uniref:Methyltransferase domain-containing protein n=1 Tax=Pseudomonas asiatica TaxID=2219225 RepID=A0ABU5L258_9PSED|nr:methyltransferase domain-containing protein [Pseudomonas asiatica]MDZ5740234.1 methyltransferase domain-containing protein [Pseudomonas asiatica]MDZ5742552.1 methyltransferase domain-containing protein [Pseudomonas asiatica]MDZ5750338.1 methyltransferase domain-containing protein [Pseudomonas asiatica]MDZ5755316.1 methyltransferase domain-containing protein [Pseudomonas asiatica]
MHPTAMQNGKLFFDTYLSGASASDAALIVEIGAQDVNGSLRQVAPRGARYIGVDFVVGKGVDVVLTDPYSLPFDSESVDVVVTSSCLEHSEMFWLSFNECLRILKPDGLLFINVPSNGAFHRYPVDCWRFYPDAGSALVTWAKRQGMNPALLESFVAAQDADIWNDFLAVFVKDQHHVDRHPNRMIEAAGSFENGKVFGSEEIFGFAQMPEDIRRLHDAIRQLAEKEGREAVVNDVLEKLLAFTTAQQSPTDGV